MGLIVTKRPRVQRLVVCLTEVSRKYVEDLAFHFRLKKSQAVAKLMFDFLNDKQLQNQFLKYSRMYHVELEKKHNELPRIVVNYTIPQNILEQIESKRFDFGFLDLIPFVRCLIYFFHDIKLSVDHSKDIENIRHAITKLGFSVHDKGTIDDKIYFVIAPKK